jgi:hypothetical protein
LHEAHHLLVCAKGANWPGGDSKYCTEKHRSFINGYKENYIQANAEKIKYIVLTPRHQNLG